MSQDSSPQSKSASTTLDEHFASFASRVEKIDQAIDVNDPQSLITARGNLGEIIGELEKLHIDEIDVASTAGEDDQSNRFILTKEISNLLHQTQQLYQVLDLTIQKHEAMYQHEFGSKSTNDGQDSKEAEDDDETPLAREEVAKLLLLVARAHGIGQLSDEQKSNLKMEVCRQKGYLRHILRQQDITQIMTALASVGSSN